MLCGDVSVATLTFVLRLGQCYRWYKYAEIIVSRCTLIRNAVYMSQVVTEVS